MTLEHIEAILRAAAIRKRAREAERLAADVAAGKALAALENNQELSAGFHAQAAELRRLADIILARWR